MELLNERHRDLIKGVISCYDRVIIQGNLQGLNYAEGMSAYLRSRNIRIFDYPTFAQEYREDIRLNAEKIAKDNGIEIQFIRKADERKEKLVRDILKNRGDHPGIVTILSAMERCPSYQPWHNKSTGQTYLRYSDGKCLHYYFYFVDKELGLCYMRVPTWAPFRLQIYFNGHALLASKLRKTGLNYQLLDNAFVTLENFQKAQELADNFRASDLQRILDEHAKRFCPIERKLERSYHWSIMQAEYATDIIFKHQKDLEGIYENLVRTAIHTVKPENIATFLGRKLDPRYQDEMGNHFNIRIEGSRIKHTMGPVSLKMYDKHGMILRIETTVNNPSFFKHYREVVQRDGSKVRKIAQVKKNIYSLYGLMKLLEASNRRYLEFISALEDNKVGMDRLEKVSDRAIENGHSYRGLNFFEKQDLQILRTVSRGEFNISGFQNSTLRCHLTGKSPGQITRLLKRLRTHGLIRKVRDTYKYYMTQLGKVVATLGLKLRELYIIPQLCH
jgi:DNA-binding transcriptional ArsR family regulator